MEKQDKRKYDKSKYIVKKWETEFKKSTRRNPTKADIKNAPSKIKEAYRTYWKLKTEILQSSICDLDENATDCFNSSSENCDPIKNHSTSEEESNFYETIGDNTQCSMVESGLSDSQISVMSDDHNIKGKEDEKEPLNFKSISFNKVKNDIIDEKSEVWGKHVCNKQPNPSKKLFSRSVSFQYAEKLFNSGKSKFNLRNPRKPRQFTKLKTADSILDTSSSFSEFNSLQEDKALNDTTNFSNTNIVDDSKIKAVEKINQNITDTIKDLYTFSDENEQQESYFKLLNEKTKIVIKSAPKTQNVAVNLLQKTFEGQHLSKNSKPLAVDEGWLERVTEGNHLSVLKKVENTNTSCDSGIEKSNDTLILDTNDSQAFSGEDADSGDDLIVNSDTESETITGNKLNLVKISTSSLLSNKRVREEEENHGNNALVKKMKTDNTQYLAFTTKPEILMSNTIKKEAKQKRVDPEHEKKMLLLEKKLESGKANENFVGINIEKKVYVRGRKRMTYSKYKKQKWKSLKKEIGEGISRGVLKCFKCGDIGHFSKACPSAGKELLPLEEYDSSEESPFPTLAEVAEMAKESAQKAHANGRKFTVDKESLSQFSQPVDTVEYRIVDPLYDLRPDGSIIATPKEVWDALSDFGHSTFLPGQEKAVMRILSGQSTLVTLSTGSGKSLCYQLPAYLFSLKNHPCITIVVSPLVSLMEDQVYCGAKCLKAACFHSNQTEKKRQAVLQQLKDGELSVLLISPEVLASWDTGIAKQIAAAIPPIAFACVDEAHCLYQWCHNFRPSYLTVTQVLREKLGVKTVLGLTATASTVTVNNLMSLLGIGEEAYGDAHISDTPLPDNLILSVSFVENDNEKQSVLLDLLQGRFADCSSVIIYCTRRETCEKVATFLRAALQSDSVCNKLGRISVHAEVYHAGLTAGRRNQVQKAFMTGKLRIVVATVAFGMGINKNDIRGIIHYNMPSTFENYVQEVGRAGRDREIANCHLLMDEKKEDIGEIRKHIYCDTIDRHTIRKLLQMVFLKCNCDKTSDGKCPSHEVTFPIEETVTLLDLPQENIATLLAYLQLDKRKWIKVLPQAYTKCSLTSYKGQRYLREMAKECPPLAMVIASEGNTSANNLSFDVIKLARDMNWDSGIVKQTLKKLEWKTVDDKPVKSGIVVDFSLLGFRVLSPGNLTDSELDESLDVLHSLIVEQERNKLLQLQCFYNALSRVAYKNTTDYMKNFELVRSDSLKNEIRSYFTNPEVVKNVELEQVQLNDTAAIALDIRRLIATHNSDHILTGRSIARIFHGIGSPNFPPIVWGRTKFWRLYIREDFNLLCNLANQQLILMR